jgi:hypothetical protein
MSAAEREKLVQLRALNVFLSKLTALDDETKRFDRYVQVYYKLHQQQRAEQKKWSSVECKRGDLGELVQKIASLRIGNPALTHLAPNRPITMGQRDFFQAFGVFLEKDRSTEAAAETAPLTRGRTTCSWSRVSTHTCQVLTCSC